MNKKSGYWMWTECKFEWSESKNYSDLLDNTERINVDWIAKDIYDPRMKGSRR